MRVIAHLPNDDLRQTQVFARMAEQAGLDGVVALENRHNPFLPLAVAALVTERIQLGTAVAVAFPRSPTISAMESWDIHQASGGRFYLGLGPQVKAHNERRYGIAWSAPAPRMRDYIGAVRAIWRCWEKEEPLDYHSEHYTLTLMTPNFSPRPNGLPRPPLSIAAVGPAMMRLAGERCDGVRLHPLTTRRLLEEVINARIDEGLKKARRDRRNFELVASGSFIATGPDEAAVAKVREYIRYRIAFYCSTPAYWNVLRLHGIEDLGRKLNPYPREGRWNEMAALVPDDVLDLFAVVGGYDTIAKRIEERFAGLADTISFPLQPGVDPDALREVVRSIQRIPCRFESYDTNWDPPTQPAGTR